MILLLFLSYEILIQVPLHFCMCFENGFNHAIQDFHLGGENKALEAETRISRPLF